MITRLSASRTGIAASSSLRTPHGEMLLAADAFVSPQVLMLSGIVPAD
jgi:hypothetical protein